MNVIFSVPLVILFASLVLTTNGQEIGTEICACSPRTYEFTLDFSLTCPPVNITLGDGVEATSCLVSPFGAPNVVDLVPVSVEGIDILELGQNLRVVAQTDVDGDLFDGDTFVYTSVVADPESIEIVQEVPRALQLNIVGVNADGDRIINVFIVTFTNTCGNYPIFQEGQSAGWTRFTGIGPGTPELCSGIPPVPTPNPTLLVTESPTVPTTSPVTTDPPVFPTISPVPPVAILTVSPTVAPVAETTAPVAPVPVTMAPSTGEPSDRPTLESTTAPVVNPTIAPVAETVPSDVPVVVSTDAPVVDEVPIDLPTIDFMSMTMSMEMSMPGRLLEEFGEMEVENNEFGERRPSSRRLKTSEGDTDDLQSRHGYSRLRI